MTSRIVVILVFCMVLTALAAWAPWITKGFAEKVVIEGFNAEWQYIPDGCGFNCHRCGVKESHRTLFGYAVTIEYACGMLPADSPEYHKTAAIYVSLFGQVHGLPRS